MIIDAEDQVLGRVASHAAKQAMLGKDVDIVNAEKAIITGSKADVVQKYKRKQNMGVPKKGPYQPRTPDRFFKRTIRGMLPYKKPRGKQAFKRIKCHVGVPARFEGEGEKVPKADVRKLQNRKYVYVETVCKELGAKV
jgi:large subunit ribosomal protein L13